MPGGNGVIVVDFLGKRVQIDCALTDRVEDLTQKIREKWGDPYVQPTLVFQGKCLDRGCALQDYGIQPGSTVHMVMR